MAEHTSTWSLVSHLDSDGTGTLTAITETDTGFQQISLTSPTVSGKKYAPWFLGLTKDNAVILFDPESKTVSTDEKMPIDAYPAYSYRDTHNNRIWFMNDGDKEQGNDALNCGDNGSTVTIFDLGDGNTAPQHIKTLCVGRGHHVTTFVSPTDAHPNYPKVAYVSNLLDGSISIVGNDDSNPETYLQIIHTINLAEADKEKSATDNIPNNAFPHGKQLSPHTGKIYSLNNGYGTVAVIDPTTHEIETRIDLKGCSNLLLSPCGKYLVGKGADRKADNSHVLGRLSIIDIEQNKVISELDIPDFYPSTYRFNPSGDKLYVTSAATGKGEQKDNLNMNTLFIYDATQLPQLKLIKTLSVGNADCGRRPIAFPTDKSANRVFIPNPSDASLTVIDSLSDSIIETFSIASQGGKEFNFSFWSDDISGA